MTIICLFTDPWKACWLMVRYHPPIFIMFASNPPEKLRIYPLYWIIYQISVCWDLKKHHANTVENIKPGYVKGMHHDILSSKHQNEVKVCKRPTISHRKCYTTSVSLNISISVLLEFHWWKASLSWVKKTWFTRSWQQPPYSDPVKKLSVNKVFTRVEHPKLS